MLDEGLVHILASDAHDTLRRHPALDQSREQAALRLGIEEAENMVFLRPRGILENVAPAELPMPTSIGRSDDPQTSYAASSRDRLFSPSRLRRLFA
jgi:protein-tyrosine phosphatase